VGVLQGAKKNARTGVLPGAGKRKSTGFRFGVRIYPWERVRGKTAKRGLPSSARYEFLRATDQGNSEKRRRTNLHKIVPDIYVLLNTKDCPIEEHRGKCNRRKGRRKGNAYLGRLLFKA